jgi:hypothetical protein
MQAYRRRETVQAFRWEGWDAAHEPQDSVWIIPVVRPNMQLFDGQADVKASGMITNPHHIGDGLIVRPGQWVVMRLITWKDGLTTRMFNVMNDDAFREAYVCSS